MVYLQITLKIAKTNRAAAVGIYQKYKVPFLDAVKGARSKELLVREEDVQVLHGFDKDAARAVDAACRLRPRQSPRKPVLGGVQRRYPCAAGLGR